ncbi:hypothetical protein B0H16DRAFT_1474731 [Mycena metata]|uniref:Uncharacterized protein n=1 Tax=Mycena metata TaxID=1033252 RepID=A0AAD7MJ89_9AGAR|nr:hypothetical protein B0H16DRAFT_1474731 [Mycena metata]
MSESLTTSIVGPPVGFDAPGFERCSAKPTSLGLDIHPTCAHDDIAVPEDEHQCLDSSRRRTRSAFAILEALTGEEQLTSRDDLSGHEGKRTTKRRKAVRGRRHTATGLLTSKFIMTSTVLEGSRIGGVDRSKSDRIIGESHARLGYIFTMFFVVGRASNGQSGAFLLNFANIPMGILVVGSRDGTFPRVLEHGPEHPSLAPIGHSHSGHEQNMKCGHILEFFRFHFSGAHMEEKSREDGGKKFNGTDRRGVATKRYQCWWWAMPDAINLVPRSRCRVADSLTDPVPISRFGKP